MSLREQIRKLIDEGVYDQNELFRLLYPHYNGHYSTLRKVISMEKNNG